MFDKCGNERSTTAAVTTAQPAHTCERRGRRATRRWCRAAALAMGLGAASCGNEVKPVGNGGETTVGSGNEELKRCRPASGTLGTDEEIQSSAGCQILEGSLTVNEGYNGVTDLSPISSLKVIEGDISGGGYRFSPFSLDALHNLEIVGGDLHFFNDNVTSFRGLVELHTVGGWLRLHGVADLEDLRGLERVRSFARLDVKYNPKLRTLAGLDGLEEVQGDVYIGGNDLLPKAEIDALLARIQVGGEIHLH